MSPRPGAALLRPLPLAAVAVLLFNDHWLKVYWPGLLSGKLSDVAGLCFFPLFLEALWLFAACVLRRSAISNDRALWVATLATCVVFAAVKTVPFAGDMYRIGLAALQWPARASWALIGGGATPGLRRVALWQDPTDLVALPAAFPALVGRLLGPSRETPRARHRTRRAAS